MKIFCILLFLMLVINEAQSQELIFSMNQEGISYKDENTNKYNDAVISSADVIITLQDKVVKFLGNELTKISLVKMKGQNNNINHLYSQKWVGHDEKNNPIDFKFIVNVQSKEARIELAYKDYISYYFGKFSYGNIQDSQTSRVGPASASN